MLKLTIREAAEAVHALKVEVERMDRPIRGIAIDSRRVSRGDLFIAVKGERFDGHDFIREAVERGALAVVSEREIDGMPVVRVGDTLKALHDLARHFLERKAPLVVAVTGSTGKTSTKEMIHAILSQSRKTLKNSGNFNNHIGLPLTLFELEEDHEAVVLEMGMNNKGEIRTLADIAKPDIAVITNIGESHIGRLGSREAIFEAKMEICETMGSEGTLVLNGDDLLLDGLRRRATPYRKIFAGCDPGRTPEVLGQSVMTDPEGTDFELVHEGKSRRCRLNIPGRHQVGNALLAYAASVAAGSDPVRAVQALSAYKGVAMRGSVIRTGGMTLIDDAYNASPSSMSAALEILSSMEGRKIAVLGDMLELGEHADAMHQAVGEKSARSGVDLLLAVGEHAGGYALGAVAAGLPEDRVHVFKDKAVLTKTLKSLLRQGDAVLFKGSRSTRMDEVCKEIMANG